jgi:hypothetical protein
MPFTSISLPNDGDGAGTGAAGGEERPPNVFNHGRPVGLFRYPTVSGEGSLALVAVNAPCSVSYFSRLSSITISSEVGFQAGAAARVAVARQARRTGRLRFSTAFSSAGVDHLQEVASS